MTYQPARTRTRRIPRIACRRARLRGRGDPAADGFGSRRFRPSSSAQPSASARPTSSSSPGASLTAVLPTQRHALGEADGGSPTTRRSLMTASRASPGSTPRSSRPSAAPRLPPPRTASSSTSTAAGVPPRTRNSSSARRRRSTARNGGRPMGRHAGHVRPRVGRRGRYRARRGYGLAFPTRLKVRALPDLPERTVALRAATEGDRARLPVHVRRRGPRSTDAALTEELERHFSIASCHVRLAYLVSGARLERRLDMRVLVTGASGVVGVHLIPHLVRRGHEVIRTTRSSDKLERARRRSVRSRCCSMVLTRSRSARRSPVSARTPSSTR